MSEQKYAFPTEVLSLPSKGLLYPKDHPLSSGQIDVKYMTAKEEDILTSSNLIEKGLVIDRLLESVIADPKIKLNDLFIGDKNALMVGTRVLGYGKEYVVEIEDPDTTLKVEHAFDLTKLNHKKVDYKLFKQNENKFEYELPNSKRKIEFKLLTQLDEKNVEKELKALEKLTKVTGIDHTLTTRLKAQIISVDGESDKLKIANFVDNEFLSIDSLAFRKHLNQITPDVDMTTTIVGKDGKESEVTIPVTVRFFWPNTEV